MTDTRTLQHKTDLEKQLGVKPGKLHLYEKRLAYLCHREYLKGKRKREF